MFMTLLKMVNQPLFSTVAIDIDTIAMRFFRRWRKFGFNSEYIMGQWECIAKEQFGGQWMENC